jgi:WD40 repeat protein
VASFASAGGASSLAESFQAVAEATPGSSSKAPSSSLRISSSVVDLGLPASSDAGSPSIAVSSVGNSKSATGSRRKSRYVKTKVKNKSKREFNHLFLAQELDCTTMSNASSIQTPSDYTSSPTEAALLPDTPASSAFSVATTPPAEKTSKSGKASKKAASKDGSQATWSLKFSTDGTYLASAGQDGVIRIWQVISGSEEREETVKAMEAEDPVVNAEGGSSGISIPAAVSFADGLHAASPVPLSKQDKRNSKISIMSTSTQGHSVIAGSPAGNGKKGNAVTGVPVRAPVFGHKPLHEWKGHTSDVLDLSWSKNNFLISSSMDKTVRLWHVSRKECLCAFQHPDFVTSIAFHPKDDRYFLSGSLDAKLRLWSIPDKKVHCWTQLPELITSVAFTSDGKIACAGTFVGLCVSPWCLPALPSLR